MPGCSVQHIVSHLLMVTFLKYEKYDYFILNQDFVAMMQSCRALAIEAPDMNAISCKAQHKFYQRRYVAL